MNNLTRIMCLVLSFLAVSSKAQYDPSLMKIIDNNFKSFNKTTPGAAITILQNGKVIARKTYGLASIEHKVPFTHNTVVRLPYSEGREFITIAAVLMEDKGILRLSDKVRKYFPKLPAWSEPVEIIDLINHRSGLADEWDAFLLMQASMDNRVDVSQFLQMLYDQPKPEVEPQKGYMYSNSDYGLLRLIMEQACGEDLSVWMKKNIFGPLKMSSTLLHNDKEDVIPNRGYEYESGKNGYQLEMGDKRSPGGNYYIATTANDLERWAGAHADKNSTISKAVERLMTNATLMPVFDKANKYYCFGLKVKGEGDATVINHQGVNDYTYLSYLPSKKVTIILLSNRFNEYANFFKEIHDHFIKGVSKPFKDKKFIVSPVTYSKDELKSFAGSYYDEDTVSYESFTKEKKNIINFFIENDSLKAESEGQLFPLEYISKNIFKATGIDVYLEFYTAGGISRLRTHLHPQHKVYEHIKDDLVAWNPSKSEMAAFTGKYYSKHLDFYWTIILDEEGNLIIKRPTIADTKIKPLQENEFLIKIQEDNIGQHTNGFVRFHKGPDGAVTHLTVSHPRLMHHRFDKVN
jgi:CubicO group peptidase (beta-lactamase class C family)